MYAVIETGGKQYKVTEGEALSVERLDAEQYAKNDGKVVFEKVLLLANGEDVKIGQPYVKGVSVTATVVEELKDTKVTIIKFKPKTGYNRKKGHRQIYTTVKIDKINN